MNGRYFIGAIFIILGLASLTGFDFGRFIGPLFLIFIGWMILTGNHRKRVEHGEYHETEIDTLNETFVFSGAERKIVSDNFEDGKIVAVFGGADFDLSEVKTKKKEIKIELVAVFGGVRIRVPEDWYVVSDAVGIIGGIDNKTRSKEKTIKLHITGAAVAGGIEISN